MQRYSIFSWRIRVETSSSTRNYPVPQRSATVKCRFVFPRERLIPGRKRTDIDHAILLVYSNILDELYIFYIFS